MSGRMSWDERFRGEELVYGSEPNAFLVEVAGGFPAGGRILSLGAGEGRNEIWLAERGFRVTALDSSPVGLDKLRRRSEDRGVEIEILLGDALDYEPEPGAFDAAILIFLHVASARRPELHAKLWRAIRPGGLLAMELFRREQIGRDSGGPRKLDLLYWTDEVPRDLPEAELIVHRAVQRRLDEGVLHLGEACLLQVLARKREA